jgi:drug/metabolite transporter (DMT)-like permease
MAIHLVYNLLLVAAYRRADLGYAYTLMRGSAPLLTSLITVGLLGEEIGAGGWAGVLLLSVGILVLTRDSFRADGGRSWRPTLVALANALVIMAYTVVDGRDARLSDHSVSYACWLFFGNVFPLLAIALVRRGRGLAEYARIRWPYGLAGGACSFAAYGTAVYAMAHAPIALVAALRETSVVFGMLLGAWFLRERLTPLRTVAVLLVAAGAMCIRFA